VARDPDRGWIGRRAGYLLERAYLALSERARLRDATHAERVGAPVISIGNLAVGGTGKTPCTIWAARTLLAQGARVAVVARPVGGAVPRGAGDELALLAARLPGVRVVAARAKWEGARAAARGWSAAGERGPRAILVDDGFSHLRLGRDLDVVLVDALRPLGNGHLLPRGPLREPPTALARAGILVATRADRLAAGAWEATRAALATLAPGALLVRAELAPVAVLDPFDRPVALAAGTPVVCLSGIARPREFARTASAFGLDVRGEVACGDHARFGPADWWRAGRLARGTGARLLVTAKDAARLDAAARARVLVLEVEWRFLDGVDAVAARLGAVASGGAA